MIYFLVAFLSLALLAAVFSYILLPAHVASWRRALIACAVTLLVPALFFGYSDMLGRPKPERLEVVRLKALEGTVLASDMEPGRGIFLWLRLEGHNAPFSYSIPWDEKFAESLRKAEERSQQHQNGGVRLRFDHSWDLGPPMLYEVPQEALPPKMGVPAPEIYRAPESEI